MPAEPPTPASPPKQQDEFQLKWADSELQKIANRVQHDYRNALSDHNRRMSRWREYYRRWRAMTDVPVLGEEAASNVPVPFVRWNIFTKWAKEMDGCLATTPKSSPCPSARPTTKKTRRSVAT